MSIDVVPRKASALRKMEMERCVFSIIKFSEWHKMGYSNTVPSDLNSDTFVAFFDTPFFFDTAFFFKFNSLRNSLDRTIVMNTQGLKITVPPE